MDNRYNSNEHVIEQISAYLDGALDDAVSDEVRAHIDGCTECHAEYIEVRATRQLLRRVTTVQPPHAFTLTPEMVQRRVWLWERLLVPRNVPRLATGSVLAFGLVLLLLAGNVGGLVSYRSNSAAMLSEFDRNVFIPAPGIGLENTPPSDQLRLQTLGTPQALPPVAMTTTEMADTAIAQSTPTAMIAKQSGEVMPTQAPSSGGAAPLLSTPLAPVENRPEFGFWRQFTPTMSSDNFAPGQNQQSTDGIQVLIFSIEGLLVALGAALAVGAVVAARR